MQTDLSSSPFYRIFLAFSSPWPVIPGLYQRAVPQGLAYLPSERLLIISSYMSDGRASILSCVSMLDGTLVKTLWLRNPDGTPHTGHVGGLAASREHLWVSSGPGVYPLVLEVILSAADGAEVGLLEFVATETKGSFATYSGGVLWVGEFTRADGRYPTAENHHLEARDGSSHRGWLAGFALDEESDLIESSPGATGRVWPDLVLSIPDEVQGAAFMNGAIVLSASYGRQNRSTLTKYENPLDLPPHGFLGAPDRSTPLWFLDDENKCGSLSAPPMSEGVARCKGQLAVLFESGADKYRSDALFPLERVQLLDPAAFDQP